MGLFLPPHLQQESQKARQPGMQGIYLQCHTETDNPEEIVTGQLVAHLGHLLQAQPIVVRGQNDPPNSGMPMLGIMLHYQDLMMLRDEITKTLDYMTQSMAEVNRDYAAKQQGGQDTKAED